MRETQAYIERIKRINRDRQRLELAVDQSLSSILPGQALLVRRIEKDYEAERWDPYLRALWFPVEAHASNILTIELPANEQFVPGQLLSVIGPVGQPFRFRQKLRNILLIAYHSPPIPLLLMLRSLLERQASVTMVLMGSARQYETDHLPVEVEIIIAEDNLTWSDMVMTLGWADQVFAVAGPGDELKYFADIMRLMRERRNDVPVNYAFGVLQRPLPCGVGACHACMLNLSGSKRLQCVDGPAFDLTTLRLN
ncbi:MAG: hypothetical protein OXG78_09910 [Chloroflexi bacterium]|nr:hypothetical protein [Chloroflexota bacterium]